MGMQTHPAPNLLASVEEADKNTYFVVFPWKRFEFILSQLLPEVLVLIRLQVEVDRDPTGCLIELMVTPPAVSPWLHPVVTSLQIVQRRSWCTHLVP